MQISDWPGPDGTLTLPGDGSMWLTLTAANGSPQTIPLQEKVPVQFGDIVFCLGADNDVWPADAVLLQQHFASVHGTAASGGDAPISEPSPRQNDGRRGWRNVSLAMAVVVLSAGGLTWFGVRDGRALAAPEASVRPVSADASLDAVKQAVDALSLHDLSVQRQGRRLVVKGVVPTAEQASSLSHRLSKLDAEGVDMRVIVAAQVAEDIRALLGESGVSVAYVGNGQFRVTGAVVDMNRTTARLAQVQRDYAGAIAGIETSLSASEVPLRNVSAMLDSAGVQYVEQTDGTKRFSLNAQ
ncbi:hypothetical protein [Pandoraea anhela]|uniref:hypothetical protein n=1 Tax=Pandoraea anhela TaxID=2508295 RepID=UPI0012418592|nr:hypothetical protein [Pandoraea anhela]